MMSAKRFWIVLAASAIQQYKGLEHSDNERDAFWLAQLLRLGILPEAYIYPKEDRPARDLVRLRTSLINSLQGIVSRNRGYKSGGNKIKQLVGGPGRRPSMCSIRP